MDCLGKDRTFLHTQKEYLLTKEEQYKFNNYTNQLKKSIPLAYITGTQPVYKNQFIGFDLNIKDYCKHEIADNYKRYYIENSQKKMIVPNFLIEDHKTDKISNKDIYNSLTLISEYMKKNIFIPNDINFPISRNIFINQFK